MSQSASGGRLVYRVCARLCYPLANNGRLIDMKLTIILFILALLCPAVSAQTDQTTPLHLLKPNYPVPYGIPKSEDVKLTLDRVRNYLDSVTPTGFMNEKTGAVDY